MAKMIAIDALNGLLETYEAQLKNLENVRASIEAAKATLDNAEAEEKAALANVETAKQALIDEGMEKWVNMIQAPTGKATKTTGTGTRTRLTDVEKKAVENAVVEALKGEKDGLKVKPLSERVEASGVKLNGSAIADAIKNLLKAKTIRKTGKVAGTVYFMAK